ncbi:peptidase domain-containing ABC transporter [Sphingobium sp. BHU LFT2]|uniref:peptidase domain-containing ABC transporter n=1 Tax=Sphingobium sp. BHU LFT2 TaxID=2807634 RepID=UPI001BE79968|nr:peptidase domain-containing ABC transporter [Sphingobium sp. BHU LFT2]MBT2246611.1 peptidase domain-containing ABC transporter [Sphingobium sp. BHU LFT2]
MEMNNLIPERKKVPLIYQSEVTECGLACLAMVCNYHGYEVDLINLRRDFPISLRGLNLSSIIKVAGSLNFHARPMRVEIEHLNEIDLPTILHWNLDHFVVLTAIKSTRHTRTYTINDPSVGIRKLTEKEFSKHFTGIALELTPSANFVRKIQKTKLHLWDLWSSSKGVFSSLSSLLILTVLIQIATLLSPLFVQVAVDDIYSSSDTFALIIFSIGFAILAIFGGAASWARARLASDVSQILDFQIISNVVSHLFRLPLAWFEKRYVGDVISRFNATTQITDLLSKGLVVGGLDIITLVSIVFLLSFMYWPASFIATLGIFLIAVIHFYYVPRINVATAEALIAQAADSSTIIESLQGISGIKASGNEFSRLRIWRDRKSRSTNRAIYVNRLKNSSETIKQSCCNLTNVIFALFAIYSAIEGDITLGSAIAIVAYYSFLQISGIRVLQLHGEYRMLSVHLDRLSDIVLEDPEPFKERMNDAPPFNGAISLQNVHFSYGVGEDEVLKNINIDIAPGESVAIVGASGEGKTTLIKIMVGLLDPTSGIVKVDGRPLDNRTKLMWRRNVGYVAQNDDLYSGSIAENIAFFDSSLDLAEVVNAAKKAAIHEFIEKTPMGYDSLVGDMGSALSGGQIARILLARALYRRPKVLFADEGTAHLDSETERKVNSSISDMGITRIIVAHRESTINSADRKIEIFNGEAIERR